MNIKDNMLVIKGCIPYDSKKEKLAAWRQLKQEFGDSVRIIFKEGLISYSCTVDRRLYM